MHKCTAFDIYINRGYYTRIINRCDMASSNLQALHELKTAFTLALGRKVPPSPRGPYPDLKKHMASLDEATQLLADKEFSGALSLLEPVYYAMRSAAVRYEADAIAYHFLSAENGGLTDMSGSLKNITKTLNDIMHDIRREQQAEALAQAGTNADALVRAAELLKSDYSAIDRANLSDVKQMLLAAAQNQLRQEKMMKEMAERIAQLEKKAAEEENARTLDKPQLTRPGTNGTPAP